MITAGEITQDPDRLSALCALWKASGREIWVRLEGQSMVPAIPNGCRIRLNCARRLVEVGQIIAYQRGGSLVVHRVTAILADEASGQLLLVCQGDGNAKSDPPVSTEYVVGAVTAIHRPSIAHRAGRAAYIVARRAVAAGRRVVRAYRQKRAKNNEH